MAENDPVVIVVDADEGFLDEVKRLFDGDVPVVSQVKDALKHVRSGTVDLVILGPSFAHDAGLSSVATLLDEDSDLPVVLAAGSITAPLLKAALRAGLKDVLEAPLTVAAVSEVLTEVRRSERRKPAPPVEEPYQQVPSQKEGKVITVMSAKGGSGKTVAATNLALLLVRMTDPSSVVLVDADLQFGDACLVLALEPKLTVVNAAHELHRLDETLLDSLLTNHPSGLRVLAAPLEPAFADEISTSAMVEVVNLLRNMFDYVVIDTASMLDELLLSLLERADIVIFIVDMDLPSVKNAKLALETLRLLKFPSSKIRLVLNRSNARARLDENEIERSLKMKITAAVPSDGLVPASVNEGRPVVEAQPRSKVAKGFESVADLVIDTTKTASAKGGRRRWK